MGFDSTLCVPEYVQFLIEFNSKWLQSVTFAYVAYGVELAFFFMCCIALLDRVSFERRRSVSRQNAAFLIYVTTMMTLSTIVLVSTVQGTNAALITSGCWDTNPNPAGPGLTLLGFRTWPLLNLGADGLLLWRCFVLYQGTILVPIWISMAVPCILYLGIFATNIFIQIPVTFSPSEEYLHQLILPCFTLALNVIVTTMIVARLLVYRHRATKTLGSAYGRHYTSITTILVESAVLIVFFNVFFILSITALADLNQSYTAFQGLIHIQVLSPFFIILRVARGKAWPGTDTTGIISSRGTDPSRTINNGSHFSAPSLSVQINKSSASDTERDTEELAFTTLHITQSRSKAIADEENASNSYT